jgi:hypothetical protein
MSYGQSYDENDIVYYTRKQENDLKISQDEIKEKNIKINELQIENKKLKEDYETLLQSNISILDINANLEAKIEILFLCINEYKKIIDNCLNNIKKKL